MVQRATLATVLSFSVVALNGAPRVARADGLIFQLPADRTCAEFVGLTSGEVKTVVTPELQGKLTDEARNQLDQKLKVTTTLTVSSVGQATRAGQECRWIELEWQNQDQAEGARSWHGLKLLIPELYLTRGEDPLAHSRLTFFNPKERDKAKLPNEAGFNRLQYEIDRFRVVFPGELQRATRLPNKSIETPVGRFTDCGIVAGHTKFDGALLGGGQWHYTANWEIALHDEAPFGVVQISSQQSGQELDRTGNTVNFKNNYTLTLSKVSHDATGVVPDFDGQSEYSALRPLDVEENNLDTLFADLGRSASAMSSKTTFKVSPHDVWAYGMAHQLVVQSLPQTRSDQENSIDSLSLRRHSQEKARP